MEAAKPPAEHGYNKMGVWKHLYLLPLSVFVGFIVTFFTTYTIAVRLDHVKPDFPYISDGGACPPESCIFGQMLNITAVLLGLTVYVRYSLVEDYYSCGHLRSRWERWLNVAGAVCGLSGAVGISIVGNFQVTHALGMHLLGAMLAFFLGVFYCWIQSGWTCYDSRLYKTEANSARRRRRFSKEQAGFEWQEQGQVPITYRTRPDMSRPWLTWVRLLIAVLCSVLFVSGWVCAAATPKEFSHRLTNSIKACNASEIPDSEWGLPNHGWEYHVCSTASEWAVGLLFSFFLLTFVYEFRLVTVEKPKLLRVATVLQERRWVGVECLDPPPPLLVRRGRRPGPAIVPVSQPPAVPAAAERYAYLPVGQSGDGSAS